MPRGDWISEAIKAPEMLAVWTSRSAAASLPVTVRSPSIVTRPAESRVTKPESRSSLPESEVMLDEPMIKLSATVKVLLTLRSVVTVWPMTAR